MKYFYSSVFLLFSLIYLSKGTYAQGIIVNEVSNGTAGVQEYVELVVLGDPSNPTANVNLSGWIIDDNNGSFENLGSGVGIAVGHIRISPSCLTAVAPGTIIVIYNSSEANSSVPPDDLTDSNNDNVYIIPSNSSCIEYCSSTPSTTSSSYSPCTGGYTTNSSSAWNSIGLRNGGDAIQTLEPDGTFFHGFSYGDVGSPFPTFPDGSSSFNVATGSGTGRNFSMDCGNYYLSTSFASGSASTDQTPGVANSANNQTFLNEIAAGSFDYSDLSSASNCDNILPVEWISFHTEYREVENCVSLFWVVQNEESHLHYIVEKSKNGIDFEDLTVISISDDFHQNQKKYSFKDYEITSEWLYYRVKQIDIEGTFSLTPVRAVHIPKETLSTILFPNPASDKIQLRTHTSVDYPTILHIYNVKGQSVFTKTYNEEASFIIIPLDQLPKGMYFIKEIKEKETQVYTFIKS